MRARIRLFIDTQLDRIPDWFKRDFLERGALLILWGAWPGLTGAFYIIYFGSLHAIYNG